MKLYRIIMMNFLIFENIVHMAATNQQLYGMNGCSKMQNVPYSTPHLDVNNQAMNAVNMLPDLQDVSQNMSYYTPNINYNKRKYSDSITAEQYKQVSECDQRYDNGVCKGKGKQEEETNINGNFIGTLPVTPITPKRIKAQSGMSDYFAWPSNDGSYSPHYNVKPTGYPVVFYGGRLFNQENKSYVLQGYRIARHYFYQSEPDILQSNADDEWMIDFVSQNYTKLYLNSLYRKHLDNIIEWQHGMYRRCYELTEAEVLTEAEELMSGFYQKGFRISYMFLGYLVGRRHYMATQYMFVIRRLVVSQLQDLLEKDKNGSNLPAIYGDQSTGSSEATTSKTITKAELKKQITALQLENSMLKAENARQKTQIKDYQLSDFEQKTRIEALKAENVKQKERANINEMVENILFNGTLGGGDSALRM